uniref:Uncharacterized protein n=1 Tax=Anguilla anguilla TaxID=7936 RepID=A0A0E9WYK4_ANGAN
MKCCLKHVQPAIPIHGPFVKCTLPFFLHPTLFRELIVVACPVTIRRMHQVRAFRQMHGWPIQLKKKNSLEGFKKKNLVLTGSLQTHSSSVWIPSASQKCRLRVKVLLWKNKVFLFEYTEFAGVCAFKMVSLFAPQHLIAGEMAADCSSVHFV